MDTRKLKLWILIGLGSIAVVVGLFMLFRGKSVLYKGFVGGQRRDVNQHTLSIEQREQPSGSIESPGAAFTATILTFEPRNMVIMSSIQISPGVENEVNLSNIFFQVFKQREDDLKTLEAITNKTGLDSNDGRIDMLPAARFEQETRYKLIIKAQLRTPDSALYQKLQLGILGHFDKGTQSYTDISLQPTGETLNLVVSPNAYPLMGNALKMHIVRPVHIVPIADQPEARPSVNAFADRAQVCTTAGGLLSHDGSSCNNIWNAGNLSIEELYEYVRCTREELQWDIGQRACTPIRGVGFAARSQICAGAGGIISENGGMCNNIPEVGNLTFEELTGYIQCRRDNREWNVEQKICSAQAFPRGVQFDQLLAPVRDKAGMEADGTSSEQIRWRFPIAKPPLPGGQDEQFSDSGERMCAQLGGHITNNRCVGEDFNLPEDDLLNHFGEFRSTCQRIYNASFGAIPDREDGRWGCFKDELGTFLTKTELEAKLNEFGACEIQRGQWDAATLSCIAAAAPLDDRQSNYFLHASSPAAQNRPVNSEQFTAAIIQFSLVHNEDITGIDIASAQNLGDRTVPFDVLEVQLFKQIGDGPEEQLSAPQTLGAQGHALISFLPNRWSFNRDALDQKLIIKARALNLDRAREKVVSLGILEPADIITAGAVAFMIPDAPIIGHEIRLHDAPPPACPEGQDRVNGVCIPRPPVGCGDLQVAPMRFQPNVPSQNFIATVSPSEFAGTVSWIHYRGQTLIESQEGATATFNALTPESTVTVLARPAVNETACQKELLPEPPRNPPPPPPRQTASTPPAGTSTPPAAQNVNGTTTRASAVTESASAQPSKQEKKKKKFSGLTCERLGQYTYSGPEKSGVREAGMCIDCPTATYIQNGGSCIAQKAVSLADQTQRTAGDLLNGMRSAASGYSPNLGASQRLRSAPDRGNTGPGIAIYGVAVLIAQAAYILKKRRR